MFSEKYGYKAEKTIQHECISDVLRRRVWNLFYQWEIQDGGLTSPRINLAFQGKQTIEEKVCDRLGFVVNSSVKGLNAQGKIEKYLTKDCEWYEVYDFVDIHLSVIDEEKKAERAKQYNELFEQEKAGYRIVAGEVAPITNETEIQTIELAGGTPYPSVNQHIRKALAFYADIKSPDYENSVKESTDSYFLIV